MASREHAESQKPRSSPTFRSNRSIPAIATRDQKEVVSRRRNRDALSGVDCLYRNALFPDCDAADCREVDGRV